MALKAARNELEYSRWGLVVSRKVGSSVVRNRIKRMLREILRQAALKPGWDIVVLTRPAIAALDYSRMQSVAGSLLQEAGLLEG